MPAITTPKALLMFPALFTPKRKKTPRPDDKPSYAACLLFKGGMASTDPEMVALKTAAWQVVMDKFGGHEKAVAEFQRAGRKWKWALHDGAENAGTYAGFEPGDLFLNCSSNRPIDAVDRYKDPKTGKARIITDAGELYPGVTVRALINFGWFDNESNGVTAYIDGLQLLESTPRLDGRVAAADAFGAEEAPAVAFGGGAAPAAASGVAGPLPF